MNERVVRDGKGIGGFLDPPSYPTHTHYIMTDLNRRPENRGFMCIELDERDYSWVDPYVIEQARKLIDDWYFDPPPIDREWVLLVLGYFRNCYCNLDVEEGKQWHASDLIIDSAKPERDPLQHAGVNRIRKFYPDYMPTQEDWDEAYWGTKKGG